MADVTQVMPERVVAIPAAPLDREQLRADMLAEVEHGPPGVATDAWMLDFAVRRPDLAGAVYAELTGRWSEDVIATGVRRRRPSTPGERPTGICAHGHDWATCGRFNTQGCWVCRVCHRDSTRRSRMADKRGRS